MPEPALAPPARDFATEAAALCDGLPGTAVAIAEMGNALHEVHQDRLQVLDLLKRHGLKGERVWILFKDICADRSDRILNAPGGKQAAARMALATLSMLTPREVADMLTAGRKPAFLPELSRAFWQTLEEKAEAHTERMVQSAVEAIEAEAKTPKDQEMAKLLRENFERERARRKAEKAKIEAKATFVPEPTATGTVTQAGADRLNEGGKA